MSCPKHMSAQQQGTPGPLAISQISRHQASQGASAFLAPSIAKTTPCTRDPPYAERKVMREYASAQPSFPQFPPMLNRNRAASAQALGAGGTAGSQPRRRQSATASAPGPPLLPSSKRRSLWTPCPLIVDLGSGGAVQSSVALLWGPLPCQPSRHAGHRETPAMSLGRLKMLRPSPTW
jgi:hypothetical protein